MTGRHRALTLLFAIVALGFFTGPIALRAIGVKAHCCPENHPFSPAPKLADGWNAFNETTAFLIDRMPGRQRAVTTNTWISQHLFASIPHYGLNGAGNASADQALPFAGNAAQNASGRDPNYPTRAVAPKLIGDIAPVTAGRDGWLYLEHDFDHACHFYTPLPTALSQWLGFMRMIRKSGRRVILVVPPDKSTIYPEFVKKDTPDLRCSRPGKARLWRTLEGGRARRGGILPLRRAVLADKRSSKVPVYYPHDAHWNTLGAVTFPRVVVPRLDRRISVLPSEIVNTGPAPHVGDLATLIGAPHPDIGPTRAIRRARRAAKIPGPAVLVGDSYSDAAYPLVAPYFQNLNHVSWDDPPPNVANAIKGAKTVVLEVIEWQWDFYPTKYGALNRGFQQLVARTLGQG
jgi:alginate O-acetyltransferase complex protein AlgJ